jgi:ABC-type multidrug transport system fused ATPase/permease subunit
VKGADAADVLATSLRLLRRARPHRTVILLTILVVLLATGAKALQAWAITPVIDKIGRIAVPAGGPDWLLRPASWSLESIAALAAALSAAMFAFGVLRDFLTNWLTNRILADLRNDVAEHLAYLPLQDHYDRKSGDLISRTTNAVAVCENSTNFLFDDAIVHPLMIAWALGGAFLASWKLALGAILLLPVYALVLSRLARRMRRARKKSLQSLGDMTGTMLQTFGGIKVVKAFNMETRQIAEFKEHNETYFRRYMASLWRKAIGENMNNLFMGLALAGVLVFGSRLLGSGELTPGQLTFFALSVAMINSSVRELSKSWNRLVESSAGAELVFDVLDQPREASHDAGEAIGRIQSVELREVSFSYPSVPVLHRINVRLHPGEVVALVGPSGAGKTTLCDLLCRFHDPQEGAVLVNGKDLRSLRRSSHLARTAVVTQETFLFNASIGENILYGKAGATQAELGVAARAAFIHEFITGLERGYDTPVGERGAKLSGGQRQRVAIARAILRDPDLLILDEATSSLDTESERAVQDALENLIRSEHRITVIIAHRRSTIRHADRILVLDQGRLVEEGVHRDLLARNGVYAQLYQTELIAE